MITKVFSILLIFIFFFSITQISHTQEKKKVPIPTLFNTGVDNNYLPLDDGETDPHYILALSADASFPGPDTKVVLSDEGLMDCCWMKNDSKSKWIAPRADAMGFNAAGFYVYSLSFSLYGFKPETAVIRGFWTSDNNGQEIMINQKPLGFITPYTAFNSGFYPFEINEGFVEGINTILFAVNNGEAPTGLRVVISGEAEPKDVADK